MVHPYCSYYCISRDVAERLVIKTLQSPDRRFIQEEMVSLRDFGNVTGFQRGVPRTVVTAIDDKDMTITVVSHYPYVSTQLVT